MTVEPMLRPPRGGTLAPDRAAPEGFPARKRDLLCVLDCGNASEQIGQVSHNRGKAMLLCDGAKRMHRRSATGRLVSNADELRMGIDMSAIVRNAGEMQPQSNGVALV